MLEPVKVKNMKYTNEEGTMIDCDVIFSDDGEETELIPFTASSEDTESHGVALWQSIVNGEYGSVSPYVDVVLPLADRVAAVHSERKSLYIQSVDPLIREAGIKRLQGKESEAQELEAQALAERERIQNENPLP